jgi:DNA-binding NarL/FixJ family response regulator
MLHSGFNQEWSLPAPLSQKVRAMVDGSAPPADLRFTANGREMTASFSQGRTSAGERFVIIELHSAESRLPAEFRARFRLTAAETAVLGDLADGLSNAQIAHRRDISITTVRTHIAHVLSKMGVRSRLQAGVLARAAM